MIIYYFNQVLDNNIKLNLIIVDNIEISIKIKFVLMLFYKIYKYSKK